MQAQYRALHKSASRGKNALGFFIFTQKRLLTFLKFFPTFCLLIKNLGHQFQL